MEMVIFCGIQASGKTTFYLEKFFRTHIHISMDQLNTRNKEQKFIKTCLDTQTPFVIDNTNPTKADRANYISQGKENKYKIIGYYFQSKIHDSISRNNKRTGKEKIPEAGLMGTYSKLELPEFKEGFDELFYVEINESSFTVKKWADEI